MKFNNISKTIYNIIINGIKSQNNRCTVSFKELNEIIKNNNKVVLLDVRSRQEYNEGHLNGAINIPLSEIKMNADKYLNYDDTIITYCQMGSRSKKAVNILNKLGYNNVQTLEGGLDGI